MVQTNRSEITMLSKAFEVLQVIADHYEATFTQIMKEMKISKTTLHRILYTLQKNKIIELDDVTGKFRLSLLCVYQGERVKSRLSLLSISESILRELAAEIRESVNLMILYERLALTVFSAEGEASILTSRLVPASPLNCSASGKIMLSRENPKNILDYFSGPWPQKRTLHSIMDYEKFMKERENILAEEVAYDREEYEYGVFCIAMPIQNHQGWMKAAISVTGPKVRMESKGIEYLKENLRKSQKKINEILTGLKYEM